MVTGDSREGLRGLGEMVGSVPTPKKQLVVQQFLLYCQIPLHPLCLCLPFSVSIPPLGLLIKFFNRPPHSHSKKWTVSRRPFFSPAAACFCLASRAHTHSKPNAALKRKRHTERDEGGDKEKEVRIKRNKRQAETEEMSLSGRERHEWAGALIIDRMIKADEEGFFPQ